MYTNSTEPMADLVPYVIERTGRGERSYDIFSRLLADRIMIIGSAIRDENANLYIAQMLYLDLMNRDADIHMYINSPGGSVTAGLGIYDTMQHLSCNVATYCMGQCSSIAAVLLAAGTKGKRFSLPHSRIMVHQPWGGAQGTAADITIQAAEINRLKGILNGILSKHCGMDIDSIAKDADRDFFMSSEQALEYGLIDGVIRPNKT